MQKNRLFIVMACLHCAHTTHAVERLGQFNPQEKEELENITKSVLRDARKRPIDPVQEVKQAFDQINKLNKLMACLNCAHTTHAGERLGQFNPQEKEEFDNIIKSVLRDAREKRRDTEPSKRIDPATFQRVQQALDQLNKPNLSLRDARNALIDFPRQAYSSLRQHTRYSGLNNIKTIYAVARLNMADLQIEQIERKRTNLSRVIAQTNNMLSEIMNDYSDTIDPDSLRIMQKNMELLESDLQAVGWEDLENIRNVLKEKNEEFLQLGQAEGSERLNAELKKLRIDKRISDTQDQLQTLHDNLSVVQKGGNIIPEHNLQNQQDAVKAMHLIRRHQAGRGMATIQIPLAEYIAQKYLYNLSKDQWDKLDDIKESIDSGLKNIDRIKRLQSVLHRLFENVLQGDFRRHSEELFMKRVKIADQSLMQAPVPDYTPLTQYAGIMLNMNQDLEPFRHGWDWDLRGEEMGLRTQEKEFGALIETLNNEQNLTKRDALIEAFQNKTNSVYDKKKRDEELQQMEKIMKLYGPISSNTQNQQDAIGAMNLIRDHQKGRGMATLNPPQIEYIAQKYL